MTEQNANEVNLKGFGHTIEDLVAPDEEVKERRRGALVAVAIIFMFVGLVLVKQVLIPCWQEDEIPIE